MLIYSHSLRTSSPESIATHEWKRIKHKDMEQYVDYVPNSCKIWLTLNTVEKVKQGKEIKGLNIELDTAMFEFQKKLSGFTLKAAALAVGAYHEWFKTLFCKALLADVRGFHAEHDIQGYTPHEAVIDCISMYPDKMISPINTLVTASLKAYKVANEIPSLPEPNMTCVDLLFLVRDIQAVNNPAADPQPKKKFYLHLYPLWTTAIHM